jgi:hypothetical protein
MNMGTKASKTVGKENKYEQELWWQFNLSLILTFASTGRSASTYSIGVAIALVPLRIAVRYLLEKYISLPVDTRLQDPLQVQWRIVSAAKPGDNASPVDVLLIAMLSLIASSLLDPRLPDITIFGYE